MIKGRLKHFTRTFLLLMLALTTAPAGGMGDLLPPLQYARSHSKEPEALLVNILLKIRHNQLDTALRDVDALLEIKPNFRLAHLIRGDLLMARAKPLTAFGDAGSTQEEKVADFRDEARVRLQRYLDQPPLGKIPKYLLQMQQEQRHAIVVDTTKSRLYLFENINGEPRYVTDYYITQGKAGAEKIREGDQKTPLGVYFVTASLAVEKLGDFYGVGAFPINYPNEWDKRLGKSGHGIWLHGVPKDTYSRPPRASNGCVVLSNPDMADVGKSLQPGLTPVIISDKVEWVSPEEWRSQRERFKGELEAWRRDWESLDNERYLRHYSGKFSANGQDINAFSAQKRQIHAGKTALRVKTSDVSLFQYPGRENLMVVTFTQDYQSSNLNNVMKKRQYWQLENGQWRIIYEGAA
ncbi:MAG: L,D-transpeptidase family protein [Sulfurimicrobium sp.]|nr:L,D-transpeptidase family protein [Sulfurimicrobium sp.]MDP1704756.1 L,D-transpeptidase family protein [Sulfurimicrobium sp.]MDP2197013.1 L,D-transpeptidase family protein [Sulfurimicrobium sp.]MDP2961664.1 L,D-transpeptidase family protein [Sulfurimicrobium sp.]MDP3686496.1 L,D-transpeptidase family protein [Sulfurimicrobium sp.]